MKIYYNYLIYDVKIRHSVQDCILYNIFKVAVICFYIIHE